MSLRPSLPPVLGQKLTGFFPAGAPAQFTPVGGGSINDSYCISSGSQRLFCKVNSATKFPHLFKREQSGIDWIRNQGVITTPCIVDCFEEEDTQCLVMEWITEGKRTTGFWQRFGEQLAALHRVTHNTFGLHENNYMGSVPQVNHPEDRWIDFFTKHRLEPLICLCSDKGLLSKKHRLQFDRLCQQFTTIFDAEDKPSLLHGDLWSGNFMCNQNNEPVLIDPAIFYGHRSVDLAMTTLFGGFHPVFYEAYHSNFPLPPNYKEQWQVCNLYPLLIHLYLFGNSYLGQIEQTLQQFA